MNAVLVALRDEVAKPVPEYVKDPLRTTEPAANWVTYWTIPLALTVTFTGVDAVAIVVTAVVFFIVKTTSPLPEEQNMTGSKYVIL